MGIKGGFMRVLQWTFTYFATVLMIIGSVPNLAVAKAAPKAAVAKSKKTEVAKASEDTREAFKMLRPTYKPQRLAYLYSQVSAHLSGSQKNEFQKILMDKGSLVAPDVTLEGQEVVFSQDGHAVRLKFVGGAKNDLKIYANGKLLAYEDTVSPEATIKALEKIVMISGKKSAFLWPLQMLLPEAHAFDWTTLLIGVAVGVVGYMAYKKFFASDEKKCGVTGAVCCFSLSAAQANGGLFYPPPSSGCCTDSYTDAAAYSTMPPQGCSGYGQAEILPAASGTGEIPLDSSSGNNPGGLQ